MRGNENDQQDSLPGTTHQPADHSPLPLTTDQPAFPPTLVLTHRKEKRSKCSLEPLRGRPDLEFVWFSSGRSLDLTGYLRLAVDGPVLRPSDARHGLLLIDGTWRLAERMHHHLVHIPPRSLQGCTAYPRVSKLFQDPPEGLASVEALFVAYRILGRRTNGLLDGYHWAEEFLRRNGW